MNEEHVKTGKGLLDELGEFSNRGLKVSYVHYLAVKEQAEKAGAPDVVAEVEHYIKTIKAEADRRKVRVELAAGSKPWQSMK